jgi:hypothetical protein
VVEPWSLTTCERFIEWYQIGEAFPPSRYVIHRNHIVANLKYCMWPNFKERCIQVYQFLYNQPNVKSNAIILSNLRMVYAEIALQKKVNWMIMRAPFTSKIIISTTPNIPRERKSIYRGLGRMMDHVVVSTEQVEWSCSPSNDDQTGCVSKARHEKEVTIKCVWLDSTLLDMAAQDQEHNMELQVDIAMEIQGQDPFEYSPLTDVIQVEPHYQGNVKYILQLEEELCRIRATIEEQTQHIEDLQSQLLAIDELISLLQQTH